MDRTLELLHGAVCRLAQEGSLKDRLADAWHSYLSGIELTGLPETCRAEFSALHALLCRERPLHGETAVKASIRKMSQREAGLCATRIVSLFHEHLVDLQRWQAAPPAQHSAQVVPLFAAEA